MARPRLSFAFMDPPFESERTPTFFRILDAALRQGCDVRVFAYEGAVALAFARQKPHGNSVHGRDVEAEQHPLTREWIAALQRLAAAKGCEFEWINCGLCVDERGVDESIDGVVRGSPADFSRQLAETDNTLVIGTR